MNNFNLTFENIINNIIVEGGNAIPNVSRIKKDLINKTINSFKNTILTKFLGEDPGNALFLLGSTGKKESSGDIDLGLDLSVCPNKSIIINLIKLNEICASNNFNSCINTFNYDMLHVAYPQANNKSKLVQIDLLIAEHPEFTKFYMFSPYESESKYKGAHRNALLNAILKTVSFSPIVIDNNEVLKWKQIAVNENGLFKETKTLIDLNGNRLLYKNTNELLETSFAKAEQSKIISDDVDFVVKFILGNKFTVGDITTFEKLFNIVKYDNNFKYFALSNDILKECAKNLKQSESRLEFPKELRAYL